MPTQYMQNPAESMPAPQVYQAAAHHGPAVMMPSSVVNQYVDAHTGHPAQSANMPQASHMPPPQHVGPGGLQHPSRVQDQNVAPGAAQAYWKADEAVKLQPPPLLRMTSLCTHLVQRLGKHVQEEGSRDRELERDILAFLKNTLDALDQVKAAVIQNNVPGYNGPQQVAQGAQQQATWARQQTNVPPQAQMQQPAPPQRHYAPAIARTTTQARKSAPRPRFIVPPSDAKYPIAPEHFTWAPPAPTPQPELLQGSSRQPTQHQAQQPPPVLKTRAPRKQATKGKGKGKRKADIIDLTSDIEHDAGEPAAKRSRPYPEWHGPRPAPPVPVAQVPVAHPQAAVPSAMIADVVQPAPVKSVSGPIIASDLDFLGQQEGPSSTPDMSNMSTTVPNMQRESYNDERTSGAHTEHLRQSVPVIPSGPTALAVAPPEAPQQPAPAMLDGISEELLAEQLIDFCNKLPGRQLTDNMGNNVFSPVTGVEERTTPSDSTLATLSTTEGSLSASEPILPPPVDVSSASSASIQDGTSVEPESSNNFLVAPANAIDYTMNGRSLLEELYSNDDPLGYVQDNVFYSATDK